MAIYIKGMEMPTGCALLLKIFPDGRVGVPVHLNWAGTMVVNDAKAVPVPPHGRLIEETSAFEHVAEYASGYVSLYLIKQGLQVAPTIIPADPAEEGKRERIF